MAHQTGTATSYLDALAKFVTFATAQGWTALRNANTGGEQEVILRAPGINGLPDERVYVGIRTETVAGSGVYNWKLQGYTGYSAGAEFDAQPGAMSLGSGNNTNAVRLCLLNAGLQYWFFVSPRRAIVVIKAGISYEIAYLGLILPYGPAENLPYPLVVAGSANTAVSVTLQTALHNSFICSEAYGASVPTYSQFEFLMGTWLCQNQRYGTTATLPGSTTSYAGTLALLPQLENAATAGPLLQTGEKLIFPMQVAANLPSRNLFGELEGLYKISGRSVVTEDTLTLGAKTYIIFQGCWRTDHYAYCAVEVA